MKITTKAIRIPVQFINGTEVMIEAGGHGDIAQKFVDTYPKYSKRASYMYLTGQTTVTCYSDEEVQEVRSFFEKHLQDINKHKGS